MENEKPLINNDQEGLKPNSTVNSNYMAVERTVMAADRSLMAWVRTGLSLISFGFTIYKFLEYQREELQALNKVMPSISSPKVIGLLMIGMGIISLVLGTVENVSTIRFYRKQYDIKRPRYSLFISVIITTIGIILFLGIIFKVNGIS
jgi:putative membrane protein